MKICFIVMLIIFAVMAQAGPLQGQSGGQCVTSKCHADMGTKAYVHGPVGARICTVCHVPKEGKDHEFSFFAEKQELCLGCHETNRDMMLQDHVHKPVLEGNCIGCHDPHQSDYRYTLKGNASELCFACHDQANFTREFVHGPVAGGDCNVCHNPHASSNVNQLIQPPEQLCLLCHAEMAETLEKRHVHPPVQEKCTSCHDPHSNTAKFMLMADQPEMCINCHEDFTAVHEVTHPPVASGDCKVCHNVHASDYPRMTPAPLDNLCYSCHEDLGRHIDSSAFKHGPVVDGDCNACHNPHGSENYRLLKKFFPHEFYMPYKTENYAICFDCHNKNIALDPKTKTLTDFRDGEANLHYLHVNKEVKGRSCKACHQAHATNQQKHVRVSVPYGSANWELPVEFTRLNDGGSCVVGCHAPKEYHRK